MLVPFSDIAKLVSMVFSLFTISIASVEMKTIADSDGEQTFIEKLSQLFKTASIKVLWHKLVYILIHSRERALKLSGFGISLGSS